MSLSYLSKDQNALPAGAMSPAPKLRVAIVHDWLVSYAGSERVVAALLGLYPDADLFSIVDFLSDEDRKKFNGKYAQTSFIQKLPFARRHYRGYLPLMPVAVEQFDLSSYDLIISSSHAVAKGVITGPGQLHICYCHTPMRYAWDMQHEYLNESGLTRGLKSIMARMVLHYIRMWDVRTTYGVDQFITNSAFIARRVRRVYGRDAVVVHPPVDVEYFYPGEARQDFYLAASRMVPYKRLDLIVQAFQDMPDKQLIVIGDGPERAKIEKLAGRNVTLLGYQPDDILRQHLQQAKAFIFAAEEDFGILPVEAQACGTPVIAYGKGGALETVVDVARTNGADATGILFYAQSTTSIIDAIKRFENADISPSACRAWAEGFSLLHFHDSMRDIFARCQHELRTQESPGMVVG